MFQEPDHKTNMEEILNQGMNFVIVRNWDGTIESLKRQTGLEALVSKMGFDLPTLAATLSREFPKDLSSHSEYNNAGERTEDVLVETITVNSRPLDRLLVTAYPLAANAAPAEMTQFQRGGEVIFITEGEAVITYAQKIKDGVISRLDLKSEKVGKGDLIISTDTPNNWTQIIGDKFTFVYFVGNPDGQQRYGDIPKEKIPVK